MREHFVNCTPRPHSLRPSGAAHRSALNSRSPATRRLQDVDGDRLGAQSDTQFEEEPLPEQDRGIPQGHHQGSDCATRAAKGGCPPRGRGGDGARSAAVDGTSNSPVDHPLRLPEQERGSARSGCHRPVLASRGSLQVALVGFELAVKANAERQQALRETCLHLHTVSVLGQAKRQSTRWLSRIKRERPSPRGSPPTDCLCGASQLGHPVHLCLARGAHSPRRGTVAPRETLSPAKLSRLLLA